MADPVDLDALRTGLSALRAELVDLRGVLSATASPVARATAPPASSAKAEPPAGERPAAAVATGAEDLAGLARSARELLARGRVEDADEVVRSLEGAARRLREDAPRGPGEG